MELFFIFEKECEFRFLCEIEEVRILYIYIYVGKKKKECFCFLNLVGRSRVYWERVKKG